MCTRRCTAARSRPDQAWQSQTGRAAPPRSSQARGCPSLRLVRWLPTGSTRQLPFGSVRQLPVEPGAPCGVVQKFYASTTVLRKGFGEGFSTSFAMHRVVHKNARMCPQAIPNVVHISCAQLATQSPVQWVNPVGRAS